jgi:phage protein D
MPVLPKIDVPTFEIKVAGKKLEGESAKRVIRVSVNEQTGLPTHFSIQLYDPEHKLIDSSKGDLREGTEIEISMGYVGDTLQSLVQGTISTLHVEFPSSGPPTIHVEGYDHLHRFTRGNAYRREEGSKDTSGRSASDIVSDIVQDVSLSASVDTTAELKRPLVQSFRSDLDLLQELARLNNYSLWADGKTIHFKKKPPSRGSVKLEWGKTLISFSSQLGIAGLVDSVKVPVFDIAQKETAEGVAQRSSIKSIQLASTADDRIAKGSGGRSELVVPGARVTSSDEAATHAKAVLTELVQQAAKASGVCAGNPSLRAGTSLELKGLGRFDGTYVVSSVVHSLGEDGYHTSFTVSDPPDLFGGPDHHNQPGMASSAGMVIGIVTANQDDQHPGQVKVKFPGLSKDEIAHWAWVCAPLAGSGRGALFFPEKDDQVLVGFEHGDMSRPYVVGSLWNGKDKPPDGNADGKNNVRMLKSRSGHIIRLDDSDGSEKIEIIDKTGNNKVTFDAANNTIKLESSQDISIEASKGKISLNAKQIEIKSTSDMTLDAQGKLDMSSKSDVTVKGQKINLN